jgi:tetratricopeptide (TPR) repeat protein
MLDQRMPRDAVEMCGEAAEMLPESSDRAMNLGTALARAGELAQAERALNKAIALDPSLKHAYVELWSLYDRQQKIRELTETSDRFLNWNPQNIMFRVLKATIAAEPIPPARNETQKK